MLCTHENCSFKTTYKRSLIKHIQQKHMEEKAHICEICGFQTRHKASLDKHRKLHMETKQYKCSECSFSSYAPSEVILHGQRKHLKRKNLACPKCPFRTGYFNGLKKHMERHKRKEEEELMGMGNKEKAKKKPPVKKVKYFCCSVCGDVMTSLVNAKEHIQNFHCTSKYCVDATKKPLDLHASESVVSCKSEATIGKNVNNSAIDANSICVDIIDNTNSHNEASAVTAVSAITITAATATTTTVVDVSDMNVSVTEAFGDKTLNLDNLLDVDISSEVLDIASNMLSGEMDHRKDDYSDNNVDMSSITHHHHHHLHEPMSCQEVYGENDESPKSPPTVTRKGGNPMLSATSDALADIDSSSSFLEDSLFDLMSDFPRPPTLNRCQSASTLMFASLSQPMVDRPLTPDFFSFSDSPAQPFFQNFASRNMDQDHFPGVGVGVGSILNQPFQISSGFSSQMDLLVNPTAPIHPKPLSPVLPNFTCFSPTINHHHPNPEEEDEESINL